MGEFIRNSCHWRRRRWHQRRNCWQIWYPVPNLLGRSRPSVRRPSARHEIFKKLSLNVRLPQLVADADHHPQHGPLGRHTRAFSARAGRRDRTLPAAGVNPISIAGQWPVDTDRQGDVEGDHHRCGGQPCSSCGPPQHTAVARSRDAPTDKTASIQLAQRAYQPEPLLLCGAPADVRNNGLPSWESLAMALKSMPPLVPHAPGPCP